MTRKPKKKESDWILNLLLKKRDKLSRRLNNDILRCDPAIVYGKRSAIVEIIKIIRRHNRDLTSINKGV